MRGANTSWVLLAALFSVACGARSELDVPETQDASALDAARPRDAAHDALPDVTSDVVPVPLSPFCLVPDAGRPASVCTVSVSVGPVITQGGCYVDVVVHDGDTGFVEYACDGTSTWAQATFGAHTFEGSVTGTTVNICIGTTYPWSDGPACDWNTSTWASAQRIYGDVTSGLLTFVYDEERIAGTSCARACTAQADISVQ